MSDETDHLAGLSDGAGCAEVWEHLSEQRDREGAGDGDDTEPAEGEGEDPDGDDADTADAALLCP